MEDSQSQTKQQQVTIDVDNIRCFDESFWAFYQGHKMGSPWSNLDARNISMYSTLQQHRLPQ